MTKRKRRSTKKSPIIKYFFTSMLIISLIALGLIYFIDILPTEYNGLLAGLFIVVNLFLSCLLFSKKIGLRVLGSFLTTFYLIIMIIAIIYELNTIDFLKKIGNDEYSTLNYKVVVLKDSKYNKIEDIKNEKLGITKDTKEEVLTKLSKKVKVNYDKQNNYTELIDNLDNKKINTILLEDSQYEIIKEENFDLSEKTKVIYKFSVDIKQKQIKDKVNITKRSFNVFISGIDTYGKINSVSRSDVNIIATVNPEKGKIILTSIPRDYYVKLSNKKEYDKLTHAGIYGVDESVKTVEDLLGININYYVKVNFSSLIKIVNTLDGIDVNSKYAFTSRDGYTYSYGMNHMNGDEALSFSRERKALPYGDKSRGENQQEVLAAIIKKSSSKNILTKYNTILKSLKSSFVTNLTDREITSFIKMLIKKDIKWDITYVNLDGTDGYEYTYSYAKKKLYVMLPDEESIVNATNEINANFEK